MAHGRKYHSLMNNLACTVEIPPKLNIFKIGSFLQRSPIFGAIQNNQLVGCAGFFICPLSKMSHRGVVFSMYIKNGYRGKGIGDALLKAVIAHAKDGVMQLHLTVVTTNQMALKLYQKNGFRIYGTEPRSLKIGDIFYDEHMMVLEL
jgi:ribosomal protein S18 acetylase RimI-like enzyme